MNRILKFLFQVLFLILFSGITKYAIAGNADCLEVLSDDYFENNQKLNSCGIKYNFDKIAQDMITATEVNPSSLEVKCLSDLYENEMEKAGQVAGETYSKSACQASCKAIIRNQKEKLGKLDIDLKKQLASVSSKTPSAPEKCSFGNGPVVALKEAKNSLCCGNKSESGTGAVRGIYPEIT